MTSGSGNGGNGGGRDPNTTEQLYRKAMQKRNKKQCNHRFGVCQSEKISHNTNVFHGFGR